jgi:Putative restriction endonuclease
MDDGSRATIADLHRVEGQAELIAGRIVRLPGHGVLVGRVVMEIAGSLHDYEERVGIGEVHTSTLGYVVPMLASGRESFCADVSYYIGPFPDNPMAFIVGPPTFAVEIRDEVDYGPRGETAMAAKRADYFEAGTLVVWDVDVIGKQIHAYRPVAPTRATTFALGEIADAEPAVPGWRIAVDKAFGPITPA